MFRIVRIGLLSLIAWSLTTLGQGQAQTPEKQPAPPTTGRARGPSAAAGPAAGGMNEVVATVTNHNETDTVTRGDVLEFLSRYPLPPNDDRETAYHEAVDALVNTHLLNQFLARQNIPVAAAKVDEELEKLKEQLKKEGQDLPSILLQNKSSIDELRKVYENRIRWSEYVKAKATDATLRKFLVDHRDLFSGTQVRASHILLKVDPNASVADKEKVKQKLAGIRNEIIQGKVTFAAAANKYSDDPANAGGAGGDLDFFTINSGLIEDFANVAFKLKKGEISGLVETEFGYHLIQVTDRREGKVPDFEQSKPYIFNAYATEQQRNVLTAERKTAKIDIKPMPKGLFPAEQPAAPAEAGGAPASIKGTGSATPKT
jgi:peptidyl-prolyl cis-trans isomerase C